MQSKLYSQLILTMNAIIREDICAKPEPENLVEYSQIFSKFYNTLIYKFFLTIQFSFKKKSLQYYSTLILLFKEGFKCLGVYLCWRI